LAQLMNCNEISWCDRNVHSHLLERIMEMVDCAFLRAHAETLKCSEQFNDL
jgi:hypothetical protein